MHIYDIIRQVVSLIALGVVFLGGSGMVLDWLTRNWANIGEIPQILSAVGVLIIVGSILWAGVLIIATWRTHVVEFFDDRNVLFARRGDLQKELAKKKGQILLMWHSGIGTIDSTIWNNRIPIKQLILTHPILQPPNRRLIVEDITKKALVVGCRVAWLNCEVNSNTLIYIGHRESNGLFGMFLRKGSKSWARIENRYYNLDKSNRSSYVIRHCESPEAYRNISEAYRSIWNKCEVVTLDKINGVINAREANTPTQG